MMIGFLNFYSGVLSVRHDRAEQIANNIANADTPNFKATDVDFGDALTRALDNPNASPTALFRTDTTVGLNGNDVSLDKERVEDSENGQQMEGATTFLRQSTNDLITALRPNPGGN